MSQAASTPVPGPHDAPSGWRPDSRLNAELAAARLDRANLLAAIRATLAAHADGEPDPLFYLRDEMDARQIPPQHHGRAS